MSLLFLLRIKGHQSNHPSSGLHIVYIQLKWSEKHLESLPGGMEILIRNFPSKILPHHNGISPFSHIYQIPKGYDQQSKRGRSMSSLSTVKMRSKLLCPSSKELKRVM